MFVGCCSVLLTRRMNSELKYYHKQAVLAVRLKLFSMLFLFCVEQLVILLLLSKLRCAVLIPMLWVSISYSGGVPGADR